MQKSGKTQDFTEGSIGKQLLRFSAPLFVGSLIQQLYNTVDLIFAGRLLGKEAAASIGASSLMVACILGVFTGLSVGIGVLIAKYFARKEFKKVAVTLSTAVILASFFALVFTFAGIIATPFFLDKMNTPDSILHSAVLYLRLYMLSLLPIVAYSVSTGILNALGNSKIPVRCQLAGGIANVALNVLFVAVFDMGINGIAMATVLSQALAAVLVVRHLFSLPADIRLDSHRMAFDFEIAKNILIIGIPSAIQSIVITLSNLAVQASINQLGVTNIAAFTTYFKVENLVYLPVVALGQACLTFYGQNMAAERFERAKQGLKTAILIGLVLTIVTSSSILIFSRTVFSWFVDEPDVLLMGSKIVSVTFPFYFIYVFFEMLASSMRGAGKTAPVMWITLLNMCVIRIGLLTVLMRFKPSVQSIAALYPITWLSTSFFLYMYYRAGMKTGKAGRFYMRAEKPPERRRE